MDCKLLPYENEEGMDGVRRILGELAEQVKKRSGERQRSREQQCSPKQQAASSESGVLSAEKPFRIGILIGPEGGFEPAEVELAVKDGWQRISLGRRILRTETAGMALLSVLVYLLEP